MRNQPQYHFFKNTVYALKGIIIIQREGEEPVIYTGVREADLTQMQDGSVKTQIKSGERRIKGQTFSDWKK